MGENEQLEIIKTIFAGANKNRKFILIKGGWNIDLSFGKRTRDHSDIDFHYDLADKDFWISFFKENGYQPEIKDDWYIIFQKSDNIQIDFEGVKINGKTIIWNHGRESKIEDVCEPRKYLDFDYTGMRLNVEKYLKEGRNQRKKDKHDLNLIETINKRKIASS